MGDRVFRLIWAGAVLAGGALWAQGPPYAVGHRTVTYYDPARGNRAVLTEIYYPAASSGDNVPVAEPEDGGFPVIAFGHGYLMTWSAYENVWGALVPQGYLVALPRTEGGLAPSHLNFGLDLAFLVNRFRLETAEPSSPFFGALSQSSAVMGHSMGGGAAVLGAEADTTISALANLAAAETNPSAIAAASGVGCPSLVISGSYDGVAPPGEHQIPIYTALGASCKTFLSLTGGSHCQFAQPNFYCELGEIGAQTPLIDRPTQHALVSAFLLPWLDFQLKGDDSSWGTFEAMLVSSDGVTFQHECDVVSPAPPVIVSIAGELPSLTLTWLASPFAEFYRVYASAEAFRDTAWDLQGVTADTSWAAVEEGTRHFYRITAVKGMP